METRHEGYTPWKISSFKHSMKNRVTKTPSPSVYWAVWFIVQTFKIDQEICIVDRFRLNYATTHHHPPPTRSQNISTTTHHQPKYVHHHPPAPITSQSISATTKHHPPPVKIYPLTCPTTYRQPKRIHQQQQSKIYPSKKLLYKKNIEIFYWKVNDGKQFD